MAEKLAYFAMFYLIDGIVWMTGIWLIATRFFGYAVKASKSRRWVFLAAILLNALLGSVFSFFELRAEVEPVPGSGGCSLFGIIYWMFYLKEPRRGKRFVSLYVSEKLTGEFMMLMACLLSGLAPYAAWTNYFGVYALELVTLGVIGLTACFSSRRRREPMRFSLIISIWVFCVLLEFVLSMFDLEGYEAVQPIVKLKIEMLIAQDRSRATTLAIVAAFVLVFMLFLVMVVRESESDYFQRKNAVNEYYLEAQKEHYASLIESSREIRRVKHDMKNHIYCLRELCERKNYEELGNYLNEIDETIQHADIGIHVGNEIADAIIAEKRKKAAEKEIAFTADGDMSGVSLAAIDICTIFSNLIDNALEAVCELPGPERRITLEIRKNKNFLLILESNPAARRPEIQDNTIATTKKDKANHGFGLANIREAAAKYDGECQLEAAEREGRFEFTIAVMIPL